MRFPFLILFSFVVEICFSQVSENGQYVFSYLLKDNKNTVLVHKFKTKELVRLIQVSVKPTKIIPSYSGLFFIVLSGDKAYLYDVIQSKLIKNFDDVKVIKFTSDDEKLIVLTSNSFFCYETASAKQLLAYNMPKVVPQIKYYDFEISPKSKYIAAKAVDRIYFYEIDNSEIKTFIQGFDVKFSNDDNWATVLSVIKDQIKITKFKTSTFYQERIHFSDNLLKNYTNIGELLPTRCTLSPTGMHLAMYTAKQNRVQILVFNTLTAHFVREINNFKNLTDELYPIEWIDDFNIVCYNENFNGSLYDLTSTAVVPLYFKIDLPQSPNINLQYQKENGLKSPFYRFFVVTDGKNVYIRDCQIPNRYMTFTNASIIGFTPDEKFLFILKDGIVNAIHTTGITLGIQTNQLAKLYAFDNIESKKTEQIIAVDAKPPKGYAYFLVNNTKQIVLLDTVKLHLVFRSLFLKDDEVELHVNLVDKHGNSFLGATDASWLYIWCNLLLQNPQANIEQINNFVIEERFENEPIAYALVLDHSGSMGDERVNKLQQGAWELIKSKKADDEFLLIKYDSKVIIDVPLAKNMYVFESKLRGTGMSGFGGQTALVDAIYIAAKNLTSSQLTNKQIILFTDGYENASITPLDKALRYIIDNKIKVNVIAFGNEVNEQYLKNIAYSTKGIFVHIYKTEDLPKIFKDLDVKRRHYYSLKFKTKSKGKHIAFLQLCQELGKHDSLFIPFDNSPLSEQPSNWQLVPPLDPKNIRLTEFEKLKIPPIPTMRKVVDKDITTDFQSIKFPNIEFDFNSDKIISSEEKGIEQIVEFMRKYPFVYLEIHGHTDNVGTPEYNLDLSLRRANAAKKLIVAKGIAPGRIVTKGFGNTKPLAPNDTEQNRKKNRRIEFYIFTI